MLNISLSDCPALINPPTIEKTKIEGQEKLDYWHGNYKTFSFYSMEPLIENQVSFINKEGLYFDDYVGKGERYLTGNELLYYPTLAKKIRALKEYPILKRTYPINNRLMGMDFFDYFSGHVRECFRQFQSDLTQASHIVDDLVEQYGQERYIPMIDGVELDNNKQLLVINGITWELARWNNASKVTETIDLHDLFDISAKYIRLEKIIPGKSFIALRLKKVLESDGYMEWFDLNTAKQFFDIDMYQKQDSWLNVKQGEYIACWE